MHIEARDKSSGTTLDKLNPGDLFVRDACHSARLGERAVYMVLHQHSRFQRLRNFKSTDGDVFVVQISNGRLSALAFGQPILQLSTPQPIYLHVKE